MTHKEKVEYYEELLKNRGYWVSNAIPPVWRILWRLGFETPPPYFLSYWRGVLSAGIPFGLFMGTLFWLLSRNDKTPSGAAIAFLVSGVCFGLTMAAFWRNQSKSLQLPPWDLFPDDTNQA